MHELLKYFRFQRADKQLSSICKSGSLASKISSSTKTQAQIMIKSNVVSIFPYLKIQVDKIFETDIRQSKESDNWFTNLVYLFSNPEICKVFMKYFGTFKYVEMAPILSKLYEGFATTNNLVEQGTILYTSIDTSFEDVDVSMYKEGEKIYWPKLTRATKKAEVARYFCKKGGIFVAIELDYCMPHFHICPDSLIDTNYVYPNGVYIFPWFYFKIHKVIKYEDLTLVFAKQTSHDEKVEGLSCLLREKLSDSYRNAIRLRTQSINMLIPIFTEAIAYELLMIDQKTKIPLDSWEC